MKFSRYVLAATVSAVLFLVGCSHEGGGSIAILDLGRIASETGQDEVFRQKAESGQRELNAQLQTLAESLDAEINAEREKAGLQPGMAPGEKDAARIQQMTAEARQQLMEAQQQAQQQAQQLQTQLVLEFRDAVMPVATKIAGQQGANVILSKDAYIFWADEAADITDAVIAAWKAEQPDTQADAKPEPAAASDAD